MEGTSVLCSVGVELVAITTYPVTPILWNRARTNAASFFHGCEMPVDRSEALRLVDPICQSYGISKLIPLYLAQQCREGITD